MSFRSWKSPSYVLIKLVNSIKTAKEEEEDEKRGVGWRAGTWRLLCVLLIVCNSRIHNGMSLKHQPWAQSGDLMSLRTHGTHWDALILSLPSHYSWFPCGFALGKKTHVQESGIFSLWFACMLRSVLTKQVRDNNDVTLPCLVAFHSVKHRYGKMPASSP